MVAVGISSKGRLTAEYIAVGCFENGEPDREGLAEALVPAVQQVTARPGWKGRKGQRGEGEIERKGGRHQVVGLWGLGPEASFGRKELEGWLLRVAADARTNGASRLAVILPPHAETRGDKAAQRICQLLMLSEYRFDRFRERQEVKGRLAKVQLVPPAGEEDAYRTAQEGAQAVSAAVSLARDLANTPPSEATPAWLEEQAQEVLGDKGFEISVLGPAELEAGGFGGILAVGRGSSNPPRMVVLKRGSVGPKVALVGKGVTFDSGGLSLKSSSSMLDMKYDKCGACSMLAIAQAVADLDLEIQLRVYLPFAENMPDGAAYRPSDIIRCYSGKTVEIVNTDAEGRMLLADALALAVEEDPDYVLEYSTLTGGSVVGLGVHGAALFSPDDELAEALLRAGDSTGERLWRMPLWPEYGEEMKGVHADLRNSAGRWGSPGTAAGFLSHFVGDFPHWAHVDIAGTAHHRSPEDGKAGATGYGVALALDWMQGLLA